MTVKIFGAGMAGLLAARILRAKGRTPHLFELQPSLPDNHAALLRFRTDAVANATGIPFRKVSVQKALWDGKRLRTVPTLLHNNQYSLKVTGRALGRSILNLAPVERFIAPPDFLVRLGEGLDITYGAPLEAAEEGISTIPMPILAKVLGVTLPVTFEAKEIWTDTVIIDKPNIDVFQTVYFTDPDSPLYRASITGNRLTMEFTDKPTVWNENTLTLMWNVFGIRPKELTPKGVKSQKFGKLLPIDEEVRRSFIMYATDRHKIFSVGRFATWRQILLDDVVHDVEMVHKIMSQIDRYGLIKEQSKKGN